MSALEDELKIVRAANPTWSFEQCWNDLESNRPSLFSSTTDGNRVRAKRQPGAELVQAQQQAKIETAARRLMARDPALTMGRALSMCDALPRVEAEIEELLRGARKRGSRVQAEKE